MASNAETFGSKRRQFADPIQHAHYQMAVIHALSAFDDERSGESGVVIDHERHVLRSLGHLPVGTQLAEGIHTILAKADMYDQEHNLIPGE